MPSVSWGFLGVWAGGQASPAQTLIGPDRRMLSRHSGSPSLIP
jgi:hypothetical protein